MPELPEVEIIRRYLDDALCGRVIESVTIMLPRQLKHPDSEDFRVLVRGQRIERVAAANTCSFICRRAPISSSTCA